MTPQDQCQFVDELTTSIATTIKNAIDAGKVPPHWDGRQLRAYLADAFIAEAQWGGLTTLEKRAYVNDLIVQGL